MKRLEINEIIALINAEKHFETIAFDGSFSIKINRYLPYCCTAIHDGSNLRNELKEKINHDEYNRWYEEDPFTGDFISSMPITLIGNDSRFEYDLNRKPNDCIFDIAWDKKVWKKKLTPKERQKSIEKHNNYYKVTHALIKKLEALFGGCVVYDIHSYNFQRWDRKVPLFNIGAENIDMNRFGNVIEHWRQELGKIEVQDIENNSAINDVFYGRGYNLEYITKNFKNTLVLATEIKKVYCNEISGDDYPNIIKTLQKGFKKAILNNANFFNQKHSEWEHQVKAKLLDKTMDSSILKVDKELFRLLKGFELLASVNPINNIQEKKRFFKNKCTETPNFKYNPIKINPFELKQKLSNLRVQDISDVSIRHLYESVINSYFDKIDMLSELDTPKFLYNSLRYFGRPSKKDIQNAHYFLHLPDVAGEPKRSPSLGVEEAMVSFKEGLENYGFKSRIEKSNRVISQVMVLNAKKTILFRPDAKFTRSQINALVEHEIGVHMVTTMNSNAQKLNLFNLGLPVNTMTQEGLAILSEYLSGNISMKRLKKLAYRVIIVDMMCNGADFIECYNFLVNDHDLDKDDAFSVVTRIFRGGGFTKDYLYLSGFVKILRFWENDNDLNPLLIGKTSLDFYHIINEMMQREMIQKPTYTTLSFNYPKLGRNNDIYEYILSGLK
ncbi:flavohemoglobin expression-modulating QEGLA motif protein [uncultured Tenacibaculum sp.]|uniref:flavohemoglobin expression-modulating QEGLA motif protein n=1 Tax=uncultured Tenacibaculum sp. TaxID=174713 RepID=UPI00262DF885|nr:flavohemoglobin expression-modulating QEGLA motif protein [uncultured Tenacibaculum sp.]